MLLHLRFKLSTLCRQLEAPHPGGFVIGGKRYVHFIDSQYLRPHHL